MNTLYHPNGEWQGSILIPRTIQARKFPSRSNPFVHSITVLQPSMPCYSEKKWREKKVLYNLFSLIFVHNKVWNFYRMLLNIFYLCPTDIIPGKKAAKF